MKVRVKSLTRLVRLLAIPLSVCNLKYQIKCIAHRPNNSGPSKKRPMVWLCLMGDRDGKRWIDGWMEWNEIRIGWI